MKVNVDEIIQYYVNFIKFRHDKSKIHYNSWAIFYDYSEEDIIYNILDADELSDIAFEYYNNWHNKDGIYRNKFLYFKFPLDIKYENRLNSLIEYLVMEILDNKDETN